MVPKVKYLEVQEVLTMQRKAVYEKMKQCSTSHIVYPGIDMPIDKDGRRRIDPFQVPGISKCHLHAFFLYLMKLVLQRSLGGIQKRITRWINLNKSLDRNTRRIIVWCTTWWNSFDTTGLLGHSWSLSMEMRSRTIMMWSRNPWVGGWLTNQSHWSFWFRSEDTG